MIRLLALALLVPALAFAQKPDILEVIDVSGVIGAGTAERVATAVEQINDNQKIKAVLLVLDTPGGSVTASSAIYEDLARLKVPVVVWCQSICASGGVYLAMSPSVKWISVREQTIGGSVGVVMTTMRFNRLLDWAKIDPKTYRSGVLKDAGNGSRPIEEAEDKYLQGIVKGLAERFYEIVGARRKITDWDAVKSARIFIGPEVVKVGLADAVQGRKEAEAKAKELSGSKTIFTREELKKMSSAAHGDPVFKSPLSPYETLATDAHWLMDLVREIYEGQSTRIAYLAPVRP